MTPEIMRPQRRCYGALIGLSLDRAWMLATFEIDGQTVTWEVPESELFMHLTRHIAANAKARLAGAKDRRLVIWKENGWQVSN